MKHIIIEGGDRLGKDTIIKSLCEHFNYNSVTVRHFDKPPKGMDPKESLDFQFEVFYKEKMFVDYIREEIACDEFSYHEEIVIWNRAHYGEYVYSQMFRGIPKKEIAKRLRVFDERNKSPDAYLITLTASPKFFLDQEDGESFSQDLETKTRELQLFKEAHALSLNPRKKLIKVNSGYSYRDKKEIFNEVLEFIGETE